MYYMYVLFDIRMCLIYVLFRSEITDVSLVKRLQHLYIVCLEPCTVWSPSLLRTQKVSVQRLSQLHHLIQLLV